jgi:hypothetical protein
LNIKHVIIYDASFSNSYIAILKVVIFFMLIRDNREADDIQCQPATQQTSGDQTVKSTQHGYLDMSKFTGVCSKPQATCTRQISEKLLQDAIRNELTSKKKSKKGFFTIAFRSILACFGIKNDRKCNDPFGKMLKK